MGKLALIGAILLSGHAGHLTHHQSHYSRYWWPAMDNCTITVGYRRGVFITGNVPYVKCVTIPAHYGSTLPPPFAI